MQVPHTYKSMQSYNNDIMQHAVDFLNIDICLMHIYASCNMLNWECLQHIPHCFSRLSLPLPVTFSSTELKELLLAIVPAHLSGTAKKNVTSVYTCTDNIPTS